MVTIMDYWLNNTTETWQQIATCQMGLAVCPIGIISSILTVITLWQKVATDKNIFFILMVAIAILDLFFNCGFIYIRCSPLSFPRAVMKGLVFSSSLASDLCALVLTAERYLVLCWPQTMQNLSARTAKVARAAAGAVITVFSLVRMQYIVEELDDMELVSGDFKKAWDPVYVTLSISGDMILPVLLIVCIAVLSGKIIRVVVKRQRSRVKVGSTIATVSPQAQQQREAVGAFSRQQSPRTANGARSNTDLQKAKVDDGHSVVSLVLVLDLFFILNQLGYCLFAASEVYKSICQECEDGIDLYRTAAFVSDFIECLSRSLNFYFYVKFSRLLRNEFLDVVSRIRQKTC